MVGSVLIADAESSSRELLCRALAQDGFRVEVAVDRAEALAYANDFDVVIADIRLDLLGAMKKRRPSTEVVLVTCATTLDDALAAVRQGAFDFVLRPFFIEDISLTVACAAARRQRVDLTIPIRHIRRNHALGD
jgi:DNA-binding NtrC family response regulator